jgi:hypothetical protein
MMAMRATASTGNPELSVAFAAGCTASVRIGAPPSCEAGDEFPASFPATPEVIAGAELSVVNELMVDSSGGAGATADAPVGVESGESVTAALAVAGASLDVAGAGVIVTGLALFDADVVLAGAAGLLVVDGATFDALVRARVLVTALLVLSLDVAGALVPVTAVVVVLALVLGTAVAKLIGIRRSWERSCGRVWSLRVITAQAVTRQSVPVMGSAATTASGTEKVPPVP